LISSWIYRLASGKESQREIYPVVRDMIAAADSPSEIQHRNVD
jgi:hypothetical protein